MKPRATFALVLVATLAGFVGCARKVVLDPENISRLNAADWAIRRPPLRAAAPTPAPAH